MNASRVLRALANDRRLQILNWLKDRTKHFPPQVDGDLVKDGVCGVRPSNEMRPADWTNKVAW